MNYQNYFVYSPEVQTALENHRPVVALESTIIAHGFSYPANLECARECERIIRSYGVTPATIGILKGKVHIGLTAEELEYFATNRAMSKCSRRDVAPTIAMGLDGATTVTTTAMFAYMAGIKVFATGGIGGVHRHGEVTMDISADLQELAKTPIAVVCAGAKSILDIERTKEYLETYGVTILGFKTNRIPAFYTRDSGFDVDYQINDEKTIANIIKVRDDFRIPSTILITNPIPEDQEMDPAYINSEIERAVSECAGKGIKGKAVTPYLLSVLHESTKGKSVVANKALVFNNAALASRIALELSK
ncbi:Pseudouridine-5'-phosphate glycosidase [bioreactor metagenome]|uniref:Pseudouridine-5'-phosphate glycosidase n=1 Tax=bioreactor metagenome TaxID=1076179 RepID=A0A645AHW0_9ZZZZ